MEGIRTEMRAGFARLEASTETQQTRLDRHGALLQTGSRWVNRMNQWAERIDRQFFERDERIRQLEERIQKLERNGGRPSQ